MDEEQVCMICGKPRSEHHAFMAELVLPPGCQCLPSMWEELVRIWGDEVPPICDEFVESAVGFCARCDHEKECHGHG